MAYTTPTPSASYEHFRTLIKGLRQVVPDEVLAPQLAPLEAEVGTARNPRVPLITIKNLVEALATRLDDPLLMTRAFSHLDYRPTLLRRTFLAGALTLVEAIALMQRYMHVCTDLGQLELTVEREQAYLRVRPNPAFAANSQQLDSMLYAVLRTLLGLGLQSVARVTFPHSPGATWQDDYRTMFPAPPQFDADCYGVQFPAIELARALGWDHDDADRLARRERKLIKLHSDHRWTDSVATLLTVLLRNGDGSIDRCAELLASSRRTLQRRIEAEGITFRDLLEHTRQRLTLDYLARGYSSETIALLVGYRQASQFYRSFRVWFGCSPNDYRSRLNRPRAASPPSWSAPPRIQA